MKNEIMESKENESVSCIVDGYFRSHVITLTKEGLLQLPEVMRKRVQNGEKLWLIKEPKNGEAFVAMSKTGEGIRVNASHVVRKLRINPNIISSLPASEQRHLENGGYL